MDLFAINCPTCQARLKVRELSAIGQIVNCPKCGSMMQISPPPGWQPPAIQPPAPAAQVPAKQPAPATQPAPAQAAPTGHEAAAAMASALAAADSGVRWSEAVPAAGAADLTAPKSVDYVDPLAVKVDVTTAAPALPAAPSVHWPVVKDFLGAWLPWASVPVAGILSAWLVGYCLRVEEPSVLPAAPPVETTAIVAPDIATPPVAESTPGPVAPTPSLEKPPSTFAEAPAPPASNTPISQPASTAPASQPAQPQLVMRPVTTSPLDIEAAARSPARAERAAPQARPAKPSVMPPPVVAKPKPAIPSSAGAPQVDVAQALETRIASLELPSVQLLAFVQLAGGLAGAPLTLDTDACRELGVKLDAPLVIHEHDVSLRDLLKHVLEPLGLVAEAAQGQLVVTSTPAHRFQLQQVPYHVSDLNDTPAVLARMIMDLVEPQRWMEQGGAGRIDIDGPQLLISQTPRVHHQIVVLLDKLRLARGKPATGTSDPLEGSLESPYRHLAARLATPVSANYREPAELRSMVYELGQPAGVRVLVDWQSLAAAGCRPQSLVSLVVDKQPLAAALAQLLGPLELSYRIVAPDTIEITSTSTLRARPELDVYPARELLDAAASGVAPTDAIREWLSNRLPDVVWGGACGWRFDRQSSMLLVRQDAKSQRAIEAAIRSTIRGGHDAVNQDSTGQAASPASRPQE